MLLFARRAHLRLREVSRDVFDADEDPQLAVTHLIQVVGEAANRSSEALRERYPQIPWREIIGMRHRIVHDYARVSLDVIWETIAVDLPLLISILEPLIPEEPTA